MIVVDGTAASARRDLAILGLILALAGALRVIGLDAPLWFDEIATVDTHVRLPWGDMMRDYSMNHHYFFSILSKLSVTLFGEANWAYRLPAMLFGVGTVAAVWVLARDVDGPVTAHLSALLAALSYHQVWFSQNARGYTELAFWSTLGLILFLRGMRTPSLRLWIGFGAVVAAAGFTHLTGILFFAALFLLWLLSLATGIGRGPLMRAHVVFPLWGAALAGVALALVYLPVLPGVLQTVGGVADTSAVDPMKEYQNPLWTVMEGIRTALGQSGSVPVVAALAGLALLTFGAVRAARQEPLFAPAIAAHVAVTVAILLALGMRIWPRFFFVDIGLVLILLVIGCRAVSAVVARALSRPSLEQGLFALAMVAAVGLSALLLARNYGAPKQDIAGAYALVESTRTPGERVYAVGPVATVFASHFGADWGAISDSDEFEQALADPGPISLVVGFPDRMFRAIPDLRKATEAPFSLVKRFPGTLGDGYVLVFRRDTAALEG